MKVRFCVCATKQDLADFPQNLVQQSGNLIVAWLGHLPYVSQSQSLSHHLAVGQSEWLRFPALVEVMLDSDRLRPPVGTGIVANRRRVKVVADQLQPVPPARRRFLRQNRPRDRRFADGRLPIRRAVRRRARPGACLLRPPAGRPEIQVETRSAGRESGRARASSFPSRIAEAAPEYRLQADGMHWRPTVRQWRRHAPALAFSVVRGRFARIAARFDPTCPSN